MKCWHCDNELTWGGDHDVEDQENDYSMETNLSCSECGSFYLVYLPKGDEDAEAGKEEEAKAG